MTDTQEKAEPTQGQVMLAEVTKDGVQAAAFFYMNGLGLAVEALSEHADQLAKDGVTLEQFAQLLRGEDIE